jgi:hypothetical protein
MIGPETEQPTMISALRTEYDEVKLLVTNDILSRY